MPAQLASVCRAVLAVALALPAVSRADAREIGDVPAPDRMTPLRAWTPAQQYMPARGGRAGARFGYDSAFGMLVFADELGDKLSELGRFSLIERCFEHEDESTRSTLAWAVCGPDVKAFDERKLAAELTAARISAASKADVREHVRRALARIRKIGAIVDAAAKGDPGIATVLAVASAAKKEWAGYVAKHKASFERYLALKDAVRAGTASHKGFAGCWQATRPAFEKLVRATTFPRELPGNYLTGFTHVMLANSESYITAASFAACAVSVDPAGRVLAAAVLDADRGGVIRVGWRTLAVAKALDPRLAPAFADPSLDYGQYGITRRWREARYTTGVSRAAADLLPVQGTLATVEQDGDTTHVSFKSDKVDGCLEWRAAAPGREKVCTQRGVVDKQELDTEIATKLADALEPGVDVMMYEHFPVCVWEGKQLVALLTVRLP